MKGHNKRKIQADQSQKNDEVPQYQQHNPQHLLRSQSASAINYLENSVVPYEENINNVRGVRRRTEHPRPKSHPVPFPISIDNPPLKWTIVRPTSKAVPPRRGFHSCTAVDEHTFYVIGGDDSKNGFYNDVWSFNCTTVKWTECTDLKFPRTGHTCVYYKGCLYLFGGKQQNRYMSELLIYSFETKQWTTHHPSDNLTNRKLIARGAHTASVVGSKMYIFGGLNSGGRNGAADGDLEYLNSICVFDLETHTWSIPKNIKGMLPAKRAGHSSAVVGNTIYIFGGRSGSVVLPDFYAFNTGRFDITLFDII
jgi:hypothetical protein